MAKNGELAMSRLTYVDLDSKQVTNCGRYSMTYNFEKRNFGDTQR